MPNRLFAWLAPLALASFMRAGTPINVVVTIERIVELQCDEGGGESCPNDYFAEVSIDGQGTGRVPPSGGFTSADFKANWTFSRQVDSDRGTIPVEIWLYDQDDFSADDLIDISPTGSRTLRLNLNLATGDWTGDVDNKEVSEGTDLDRARIYFNIAVGIRDADGDGIPDRIERLGILDADKKQVVDLAALGADPCRKTIAVEIDYMQPNPASHTHRPLQAAIAEVTAAFDSAPVPATTACPYPGFPRKPSGIDLIVVIDDPIAEVNPIDWATGGETIRNSNFDAALRPYFHYSLWAHQQPGTTSSGFCCSDSGKDPLVTLGAFTSQVGTIREQSGTFMHELGHALKLDHGGDTGVDNCKPNYLSVMNYIFQTIGIPDAAIVPNNTDINGDGINDAGTRLDYSRSVLNPLIENKLIEANGIGAGTVFTSWSSDGGATRRWANGAPINWNNAATVNPDGSVTVDLNNYGINGCNTASLDSLTGFNDWANLKYRAVASTDDGLNIPSTGPELDADSARLIRESLLAPPTLDAVATPGPNAFGWNNTDVTVAFHAESPGGVTNVRYTLAGAQTLATQIVPGNSASVTVRNEGETVITYSASNAWGNSPPKTLTIRIDKTPPFPSLVAMFCMLHPESQVMERVGSAAAIDERSGVDASSFALTVTSSEPDAGTFPGDLANDIAISGLSVSVRAERNPAGTGRRYTIDNFVRDLAGNGAVRRSECRVPLFLQ